MVFPAKKQIDHEAVRIREEKLDELTKRNEF
jgi:hypothetical protein